MLKCSCNVALPKTKLLASVIAGLFVLTTDSNVASFPGLPSFYLPFAFTIIHGSERPAKNGEGLGAFIT